jgi:hypothetical protein
VALAAFKTDPHRGFQPRALPDLVVTRASYRSERHGDAAGPLVPSHDLEPRGANARGHEICLYSTYHGTAHRSSEETPTGKGRQQSSTTDDPTEGRLLALETSYELDPSALTRKAIRALREKTQ